MHEAKEPKCSFDCAWRSGPYFASETAKIRLTRGLCALGLFPRRAQAWLAKLPRCSVRIRPTGVRILAAAQQNENQRRDDKLRTTSPIRRSLGVSIHRQDACVSMNRFTLERDRRMAPMVPTDSWSWRQQDYRPAAFTIFSRSIAFSIFFVRAFKTESAPLVSDAG
jgi:hypothetical protein